MYPQCKSNEPMVEWVDCSPGVQKINGLGSTLGHNLDALLLPPSNK